MIEYKRYYIIPTMPSKPLNTDLLDETDATNVDTISPVKDVRLYYTSNLMGRKIRNATTGAYYPWRVGSKESKKLFRVIDSTGTSDKNGWVVNSQNAEDSSSSLPDIKKRQTNKDPNHCYFDSPYEYMKLRGGKVPEETIARWKSQQKQQPVM